MDISLATLLLSAASGVVVGLFLAVFGGGGSVLAAFTGWAASAWFRRT